VSGRPRALDGAPEMKPGDRLISYGFYLHGLPFYTESPVDVVNWVGELHYAKRNPANKARFGDDDTIRRLPDPDRTTFVALRLREASYLTTLAKPAEIDGMRTYGPWALAKFTPVKAPARSRPGRLGSPSSGDGRAPAR
ncbi:MAG: hypothetical protein HY553_22195, partial [Elusimicrobia bacterium]|nr:hypothetical protein [Elusimicrobiota bacterium]